MISFKIAVLFLTVAPPFCRQVGYLPRLGVRIILTTIACLLRFPNHWYPFGCTNFMQPLSACEGRRSPLFQYDTGCRPNFTCRTFTALSVLLQYQPLLTRGTTFLCDRRVRTLSCAMERVPEAVLQCGCENLVGTASVE